MFNKVGIIVNNRKKQPVQLARELINWFLKKGIQVYTTEEDGAVLGVEKDMTTGRLGQEVDCVITIGGDGTFLRAARLASPYSIPILGINMGMLGFLTEVELGEMDEALQKLIRGDYYLEDRMMLEARVIRDGGEAGSFVGLNDVVINKGPLARLVILDIFVGDEFVTTYKADGVIISSPTGSTAYSLSAGGPIVHPEVEVIIITPICPHTLQARPLVIPSHKTVRVDIVSTQPDSMLTIDGQHGFELRNGDQINAGKAVNYTRLVRIKEYEFFNILQEKLKTEGRMTYE
ncbi:MAG: NAD(+)/NADH kinase [Peptococcaceae bacterium]|jgi:NAD+ kinase|nr:NAD(+)/NADH kinase [Peptococcaceae bacterium]MDH7525333.1 NAD(+)/NADH kinase [Peptococcaceae bacterium]